MPEKVVEIREVQFSFQNTPLSPPLPPQKNWPKVFRWEKIYILTFQIMASCTLEGGQHRFGGTCCSTFNVQIMGPDIWVCVCVCVCVCFTQKMQRSWPVDGSTVLAGPAVLLFMSGYVRSLSGPHTAQCSVINEQWIDNYLYCCTMHFEDSLNITHQQMHQSYIIY